MACDNLYMINKILNKHVCWFCELPEDKKIYNLYMLHLALTGEIGSKSVPGLADRLNKWALPYLSCDPDYPGGIFGHSYRAA
jgi:hypothetical protein